MIPSRCIRWHRTGRVHKVALKKAYPHLGRVETRVSHKALKLQKGTLDKPLDKPLDKATG